MIGAVTPTESTDNGLRDKSPLILGFRASFARGAGGAFRRRIDARVVAIPNLWTSLRSQCT